MRGKNPTQPAMFFAIDLNDRIRPDHRLRPIKTVCDDILAAMSGRFDVAYARGGRPSIPPELLLKLMLLQALFSIKSEAQLLERLDTDLLFRWFCGMDPAQKVPDAAVFTHNRQRFLDNDFTGHFFHQIVERAINAGLVSEDHFSADGSLIQSYAAMKSFVPNQTADAQEKRKADRKEARKRGEDPNAPAAVGRDHDTKGDNIKDDDTNGFQPRNADVDFRGQKRGNDTHRSPVDPEAKLYRKGAGQASVLGHITHVLTENRSGLVIGSCTTEANGHAERDAALLMLDRVKERHGLCPKTLGTDSGYTSGDFLVELKARNVTPHSAPGNKGKAPVRRRSGRKLGRNKKEERDRLAARLWNHRRFCGDEGYRISQRKRKRAEEPFGYMKASAGIRKAALVGREFIQQKMDMCHSALSLVRIAGRLAVG